MGSFEKSCINYQKLLDIINNNKSNDGTAYFDRQYIDDQMQLSRTMTNKMLKNINLYESVITKTNGGFTTNVKSINEIEWIRTIAIMLFDTILDPTIVKQSNAEIMKKYCIDEKMVQKYRAYTLT